VKVRIKFNNDLKGKYAPASNDGVLELILKNGSKIKDAFEALQIDDGEVGFVLLNENKAQLDETISDQDLIHIFSLVAGG
jgi:molybdopterin converting factor small subunit